MCQKCQTMGQARPLPIWWDGERGPFCSSESMVALDLSWGGNPNDNLIKLKMPSGKNACKHVCMCAHTYTHTLFYIISRGF